MAATSRRSWAMPARKGHAAYEEEEEVGHAAGEEKEVVHSGDKEEEPPAWRKRWAMAATRRRR